MTIPNADRASTGARRTIGRYAIDGVLGRGGASTVYAATDLLLGRDVAVKVFTARADSTEHLREQEAEARLVAQLNHPGLTTLLDAGVEVEADAPAQLFLVMERVAGPDLRQRLRSGPLSPLQVAFIGFDLALGLQHVHEAGYLHRDIKPANVLLDERSDTRIRGKLTDFGISSLMGTDQGEFTTGTAAYLGPEQVEGLDATDATDVYSLGIVLLEALTARVAFPGSVTQSALARLERSPEIPDTVPGRLADVIRGMTARTPADRPPLSTVVATLQAFIAGELAGARNPGRRSADDGSRPAVRPDIAADTPDPVNDRIAHLARRLLGASAAVVLANDGTALVTRAADGASPLAPRLPLSDPLGALLATSPVPLSIADIDSDPRLEPSARTAHRLPASIASAPLITSDSHVVGVLAVIDAAPRSYSRDELDDLAQLAALLIHDFDLRTAARRALFRA